jgi:tRNA (guanosine-2'-O-)-methyltransferase
VRRHSLDSFEPDARTEPWPSGWAAEDVIRILEPLVLPARRERIATVLAARLDCVTVLMDAPHDPYNGGAVLRSCDAFGVSTLHVVPRIEPFLASRTVTKGTERWVDVSLHETPSRAVSALRSKGYRLVAAQPLGRLSPEDLRSMERVAIVLGNERDGISEELARSADDAVRVPMRGFVESLNVSVTAAILLSAATHGRSGDLPDEARTLLYARGLFRTVPRASEVLAASVVRDSP